MNIKPMLRVFENWHNKLKPGERRLVVMLSLIGTIAFYFNFSLKPAMNDFSKLKKEQQESQNRLGMLKSELPSADKTKREIGAIRQHLKDLKFRISSIESGLITTSQEQELLSEVIKRAQGLAIDLESVKENVKEVKEGFILLSIGLEFSSSFQKTLAYIKSLESISRFVKIDKIELNQSKNEPLSTVGTEVTLSALLNSGSQGRGQLSSSAKQTAQPVAINPKFNPFAPKFFVEKGKKKSLKVTGITYRNEDKGSTAIINGAIVREGDLVEDIKVVRILPTSVIIDGGAEKETLLLER